MKIKSLILYSGLFYLFFIAIRLFGLFSFDIQPDEVHWLERSGTVLSLYKEGKYSSLTTHLGQPGIVPSLVMAVGQAVGGKINSKFNLKPGDVSYLHPFYYCRIACALVASLVVFPLLILGSVFFRFRVIALATFLLALSPHHIGLSRFAHLDAVMTFTVITSLLFYLLAIRTSKDRYKIVSGIFWGLSIATKPTAITLVLAFLVLGFFNSYFVKKNKFREIINVYDFWALFIGHLVFALLYTRIWVHESDYLIRLAIHSTPADFIYFLGSTYSLLGCAVSVVSIVYFYYRAMRAKTQVYSYLAFFSVVAFFMFLFPQVYEGVIRFWYWTFGLSKTPHLAYGKVWEGQKGGYLSLIIFEVSLSILTLISINLILLFKSLVNGSFSGDDRKRSYLFIIFVLWVLVLSTSSKQTLRYILPVLPCLYVLASDSVWRMYDALSGKFLYLKNKSLIFVSLFIIPQVYAVVSTHPNQVVFYNALGGGVDGLASRGGVHYLIGINRMVEFLRNRVVESARGKQAVYVGGEINVPKLVHNILYPEEHETKFVAPSPIMWGSYFIRYHHLDKLFFSPVPSGIDPLTPAYEVKLGSSPILSVYKVSQPDLSKIFYIDTMKLPRRKGRLVKDTVYRSEGGDGISKGIIELVKVRDVKGHSFFSNEFELNEGTYNIGFDARLVQPVEVRTPVFEIQFAGCKKVVFSDELTSESFKFTDSSCMISKNKFVNFKIYWFGKIDVELGAGKIRKVEESNDT